MEMEEYDYGQKDEVGVIWTDHIVGWSLLTLHYHNTSGGWTSNGAGSALQSIYCLYRSHEVGPAGIGDRALRVGWAACTEVLSCLLAVR